MAHLNRILAAASSTQLVLSLGAAIALSACSSDNNNVDADADITCVGQVCMSNAECPCSNTCIQGMCQTEPACDEFVISFDAPVERTDGTCLDDLAGFILHYGQDMGGPYTDIIDVGLPCVEGEMVACGEDGEMQPQLLCSYRQRFEEGLWYMALTTYTDSGLESVLSEEVSRELVCP